MTQDDIDRLRTMLLMAVETQYRGAVLWREAVEFGIDLAGGIHNPLLKESRDREAMFCTFLDGLRVSVRDMTAEQITEQFSHEC